MVKYRRDQDSSDYPPGHRRLRLASTGEGSRVNNYSSPFLVPNLLENIPRIIGKYASVQNEVEDLIQRNLERLRSLMSPDSDVVDLENAETDTVVPGLPASVEVIVIDSDDENDAEQLPVDQSDDVALPNQTIESVTDPLEVDSREDSSAVEAEPEKADMVEGEGDQGVYVGAEDEPSEGDDESTGEDDESTGEDDELSDIWKEMNFVLETSKDVPVDGSADDDSEASEKKDEGCDHSFILKDDLGYVCRVCGVIERAIDTIFDFQYIKADRKKTYRPESRFSKDSDNSVNQFDNTSCYRHDLAIAQISPHPLHGQQMKPHQIEGFNFLVSNVITENPGGCILAHAPGSGKTFMIISFMQSFLAHYPDARPLVVLPKGILPTWKKEFQKWQVEDVPLLDFYSSKADNRAQQSEVLKQWVDQRSILFLGYQQFSIIVSDNRPSETTAYCRDVLLKCPTIMILDEGHNPRNDTTDMLNTLAEVQTPRKVVLSGTLYQNHVKEVFTILNLVRPKFLNMETPRVIMKRILSRVEFGESRTNNFCDLVEHTLQLDSDVKRKEAVIRDLREMTSSVLHYYRGDFLDDLPGISDYTVHLQLSPRQKRDVQQLRTEKSSSFRKSSVGCAVYTHPMLKQFLYRKVADEKTVLPSNETIDKLVEKIDLRDGVKAKFFDHVLGLCESINEKLLVFSQYLLPLKFLERVAACKRGYQVGKEIFMITGDTSAEQREASMEQFNTSSDARVLFGSIKACGEGISLVGASRVIILDVHLNPSVSRQAIGRAFRPGQTKKVYVYRLIAADSPEEKDHLMCFKKEQIAKRWFEWNEHGGAHEFELEKIDPKDSGDSFLESDLLANDIKSLYTR